MFKVADLITNVNGRLISGDGNGLIKGVSIDSRTIRPGELFIAIKGNRFDGHDFVEQAIRKKASAVIVNRVIRFKTYKIIKIPLIQVENTIDALAGIAAVHRKKFNIPVIGITGSNGKTTTKDMLAWILEKNYRVLKNPGTQNNQIGLPMTLFCLNRNFDVAVLEMGTNHFGEIRHLTEFVKPTIGIITNIGPAHLEFFYDLEGVYREKNSLINNLVFPSIAILNMDDSFLRRNRYDKDKFVIGFAINNNADYKVIKIEKETQNKINFLVNSRYKVRLNTPLVCNVYNCLAVISVARLLGMDYNTIIRRLSDFTFPKSRFTSLKVDNINFIDDTYNSNPASLSNALDTLDNLKTTGRKIVIMGDMLELGKNKENIHRLAGKKIALVCDTLITVGRLTRFTAEAARKAGLDAKSIFHCDLTEEARGILYEKVKPSKNDLVLVKGSRLMQMEKILK